MSNVNITFYLLWTLWQRNICYTHRWSSRKRKAEHMFNYVHVIRMLLWNFFTFLTIFMVQTVTTRMLDLALQGIIFIWKTTIKQSAYLTDNFCCKLQIVIALFSSTVNIYLLSPGINLGEYSNWQETICNIWKRQLN